MIFKLDMAETMKIKEMMQNGERAEYLIKYIMETFFKKKVDKATIDQNKYDHIDFFIGEKSYDVKHRRSTEHVWLEYRGIYGHDGWLQGKAMYIVIYYTELQEFCFYKTKDLLAFAKQFRKKSEHKLHYHWYSREAWGRRDLCLLVKKSDIDHLEKYSFIINKLD